MPDPDAARARVEQHLAEHLAALTQRPAESLPPDAPFAELGLTSLNLLQLRTRLEQSLGITVPVAIFWSAFTQTALAEHLLQALRAAPDSAPASHPVQATASTPSTTPPPDSPPRSDDAARIAALDDDALAAELDRLIDASSVSTPNPARTSGTKH
ncbi:MAG: acyl carrier protein [Myxococcota bacterium]